MRASAIGIPDLRCPKFGFPEITEESGPFWTNFDNAAEFTRVLDFVIDASETQWNETTSSIIPKVMNLDPDNRKLFQLLGSLGVAHDGGIEEVRRRAKEVYGAE
jgi:surface carbohydrate biosynthesis protein